MDAVLSSEAAGLASLLRAARELAGMSRSDLAGCLAVSWETVRQAEEGRDTRHRVLASILLAFPYLSPRALLLGEATAPPLASIAVWDFYRRHHGFVAARVRHEVSLDAGGGRSHLIEIRGVRWISGAQPDPARRTDLMRAVIHASGPLLRHLEARESDVESGRRVIDEGGARHEFRFARDARSGFGYACSFRREGSEPESALQCEPDEAARAAGAVTAGISHPVERLELVLRLPPAMPLPSIAFFVAPDMSVPRGGAVQLARALHPAGVPLRWDRSRREAILTIVRPLPNLRYGLAWLSHEPRVPTFTALSPLMARRGTRLGCSSSGSALPGRQVTAARERASLSRRELAERMRASVATVIGAEAGNDLRCSTMRRLVEALDDLRPEDLFAPLAGRRALRAITPAEAWLYYRNLVGLEAAEATRTLTLSTAGDGVEVIRTQDLRSLHAGSREVIVQDGIAPGVHGKTGPVLLAQRSGRSREALRVRWTRVPGVSPEFQLIIPASLAGAGLSFDRRDRKELAYKLRAEHVDRSIGPAYECFVPVRRLVVSVRFPRGYWPSDVGAFVRAAVNVTNPRWPDLTPALHPASLRWRAHRGQGVVRLEVERPLLGFRYSISWKVS